MPDEPPAGDEQHVRQAVEISARRLAHLLALAERNHASLRAPADGARKVRERRGARAARENEFLQRRQLGIPLLDRRIEPTDLRVAEHGVVGMSWPSRACAASRSTSPAPLRVML